LKNEIRKLKDLMFSVGYLANSEKPESSKYAEFPKTFFDRKDKKDEEK
jgi:hypothetical protein